MSGVLSLPRPAEGRRLRVPARLRAAVRRAGLAVVVPLTGLLLWTVASHAGRLPSQILPAPEQVWGTLLDMIGSGDLANDAAISLRRVIVGFAIGGVAGLGLGAAMGLSRRVESYVRPLFTAVAQVPTIGWIPLLMLPLGIGEPLKIAIIAKAALVPVTVNTSDAVRSVPHQWVEVASAFRYSNMQLLRRVVLPASVPVVFTGIRYGLTGAWKALVAVELLASSEGLGYELVWGRQMMQMDTVLAAIAAIAAIGLALDAVLAAIETRLRRGRGA